MGKGGCKTGMRSTSLADGSLGLGQQGAVGQEGRAVAGLEDKEPQNIKQQHLSCPKLYHLSPQACPLPPPTGKLALEVPKGTGWGWSMKPR